MPPWGNFAANVAKTQKCKVLCSSSMLGFSCYSAELTTSFTVVSLCRGQLVYKSQLWTCFLQVRVKQTLGSKLEESSCQKIRTLLRCSLITRDLATSGKNIFLSLPFTDPDTDPNKTFLYRRVNYKASKLASSPLQQTCTVDIPNWRAPNFTAWHVFRTGTSPVRYYGTRWTALWWWRLA